MPNEKSRKIAGILYFSAKTELCQAMKNYAKYRKSVTINKLVTFITGGVSMVIFFFEAGGEPAPAIGRNNGLTIMSLMDLPS